MNKKYFSIKNYYRLNEVNEKKIKEVKSRIVVSEKRIHAINVSESTKKEYQRILSVQRSILSSCYWSKRSYKIWKEKGFFK